MTDGIECTGYVKPLKWMEGPARPRQTKKSKREAARSTPPDCNGDVQSSRQLLGPADRLHQSLAEGVDYWNSHVMRENMPAHRPFKRSYHQIDWYIGIPAVLKHLLFVTMRTVQIGKERGDPLENQDLCYYRGLALRDLQQLLPKACADTSGLALTATLLALLADFGLSQCAAWEYHLNASRRLIGHAGGFRACLQRQPALVNLLVNGFLMLDVFGATLRGTSWLDAETIEMQLEYLPLLPDLEIRLLTNTDTCPPELLQHIIRISAFRFHNSRQARPRSLLRFEAIAKLQSGITSFDNESWTRRIVDLGTHRPLRADDVASEASVDAWCLLADCYKQATLLYLLLSVSQEFDSDVKGPEIEAVYAALAAQVEALFSIADGDPDAAIETQLFKLVNWPILMSLSVSVRRQGDRVNCQAQKDLARLGMVAQATGVRSWLGIGVGLVSK